VTGVYLFAAAVGIPLVLWFLLAGVDDGGGDGGDAGDAGGEGLTAVMFRLVPLNSLAIAAAGFGVTGLALTALDVAGGATLLAAVGIAVLAAVLNSVVFSFLRRSESTTEVSDAALAGAIGRVVVPVAAAHRGRIAVSVGDQPVYLSAEAIPGTAALEAGDPVLVVEVARGIARVTRLDRELE
jgi:membrane protein implicated in regulation of membrane protease activity